MFFLKLIWKNKIIAFVALISALGLSVFFYSYWLVPAISPLSIRVAVYTISIGVVGMAVYFLAILKAFPLFQKLDFYIKVILIATTVIIGGSVFYITNTTVEKKAYFWFLLPEQELEIYVPSTLSPTENNHAVTWFTTSLEEVSYNNIIYTGWTRENDRLLLIDAPTNSFVWKGRVGDQATIVFHLLPQSEKIQIYWNNQKEELDLKLEAGDEYIYKKYFQVPWYATSEFVFLLGSYQIALFFLLTSIFLAHYISNVTDNGIKTFPIAIQENGEQNGKGKTQEISIIVGFVLLALGLRVFNLENFPPYVDEYAHFLAAKQILQGYQLDSVYQRSLWVVTLPVTLAFRLFGNELWVARLPGVLFNAFAIIPLYLLTKKINKNIAMISAFLYASSPWIIATARNTREYAFYPFYFYWIAFGLIEFIEWISQDFNLQQIWKELTRKKRWGTVLLLLLPILYIKVDIFSTFGLVILVYAVAFLFLGIRLYQAKRKNVLLWVGLFGFGIPVALPYIKMLLNLNFRNYPTIIFLNSPQQWYFQKPLLIPIIILISSFVGTIIFVKRNLLLAYIWVLFGTSYIVFSFIFVHYFKPRYIIFLEYWFLILIAIGFYMMWLFLKEIFPLKLAKTTMFFVGLAFFSISQTLIPMQEREPSWMGYFPIDGEAHLSVDEVDAFFSNQVTDDSVLVATMYGSHINWRNEPKFKSVFGYNYRANDLEKLEEIIAGNEKGYLVFDTYRQQYIAIPLENFKLGDTQIEFVGLFGDQYVWRWNN